MFCNKIDNAKLPAHIAIIFDGNGRWGLKHGASRSYGHKVGAQVFKNVINYCNEIGIKYLTVYAFSTENFKRPKEEVDALIDMLATYLEEAKVKVQTDKVKIQLIGDLSVFDEKIQSLANEVGEVNKGCDYPQISIAVNYGGKDEIVRAAQIAAEKYKSGEIEKITKENISEGLYTQGVPDPDLIIRTSGEQRLSNFLLWQGSYSELYFTKTLWPDFDKKSLIKAIKSYQKRNRRFGGI